MNHACRGHRKRCNFFLLILSGSASVVAFPVSSLFSSVRSSCSSAKRGRAGEVRIVSGARNLKGRYSAHFVIAMVIFASVVTDGAFKVPLLWSREFEMVVVQISRS